ncbi:PDZ domain-containing protein [Anaerobacillus sp. CMMVII]|uniref:SepM family pheromone-processing serine protease n=1 Tax=Anaerobacillus sp. CMMVII TaxID=2755588 RepID=UPI0021B84CF6|nr:SepM family pheromone-processing serine protease [Anaerobacillus sp. CMMVII]MCT8139041.1 PDZ domain-containing protein [Anaerobacillus sp. CMMVII]
MATTQKFPSLKKRWIVLIVFVLIINFYQLPYYFTKPGDAQVLDSVIEVDGGYEDKGRFMLTTVRMGKANVINYLWAKWSDQRELIHEEFVRRSGETDEEYHHRQLMMMSSSQDIATLVAYNKAGKEAYYTNFGVIVTGKIENMPAFDLLELGDLIIAVDQKEITTVDELLAQVGDKQKDDLVTLTIFRDGANKEVDLYVTSFPTEIDPSGEKVGIGITQPVTKRELTVNPKITIDTNKIGGPSAGLMFSLEIYNQLIETDISKGYAIAGTGSLNEEGEVGRIGGVKQKVIAANRAGAEYFLAPNEFGSPTSNYLDAVEVVKSLKTTMKIIPIDTFEQALEFLESLEPK